MDAVAHAFLDMQEAAKARQRAELAEREAELADSRARVARRDAQLADLAVNGLSARANLLMAALIRAATTLGRQRELYRIAFESVLSELRHQVSSPAEQQAPLEKSKRLDGALTGAADVQREIDAKPAARDERSHEEVVTEFFDGFFAGLQRSASDAVSSSTDATAAGHNQQVQSTKAAKPEAAVPAKVHPAAHSLQPATPPQLRPRRHAAHDSSDSE